MNLQEHINATGSNKAFCEQQISKRSGAQQADLLGLVERLIAAGATHPMQWAFSEVSENKPQFARFLILKKLTDIASDTATNIALAMDADDEVEDDFSELLATVGEAKLNKFIKAYGQGLISNVIGLLDEGNTYTERDGTSWMLMETESSGKLTGRIIEGLHEDFLEFNE